jgi:DNA-binding PadR family transcriptional regulator
MSGLAVTFREVVSVWQREEDPMQRSDWTLVAIYLAKGHSLTPAQLQKSLFLLGRIHPELEKEGFYSFVPYHYGPFSVSIYDDVHALERRGLVVCTSSQARGWPYYGISDRGRAEAEGMVRQVDEEHRRTLTEAVRWVQSLSFSDMIRAIYHHFPDFKKNSVFQG